MIKFGLGWMLPSMLVFCGLALLVFGGRDLMRAWASASWPHSQGVVLSSFRSPYNDGGTGKKYTPAIAYSYSAGNKSYVGTRVFYGNAQGLSDSRSAEIVNRYPVRSPVSVYYKPEEPGESVLEPGSNPQLRKLLALGTTLFSGGIFLLVFVRRWLEKIYQERGAGRYAH
jgi:hypothetical protein